MCSHAGASLRKTSNRNSASILGSSMCKTKRKRTSSGSVTKKEALKKDGTLKKGYYYAKGGTIKKSKKK